MSKDSTLGMSPERLARLLGVTLVSESDDDSNDSVQSTSQLIQAHLAGTLPLDTTVIDELPAIIGRLHKESTTRVGKSLGDVLTDPKSDLDTIKKIRRHAKRMAVRKSPKARHSVAIAIYFAAIANALIFHDVKITRHSDESLDGSFTKLVAKSWMPTELVQLFEKARKVCRCKVS